MACLRSNIITLCHGKARDCIEKIYCGVTDKHREWAKMLRKEDRVHLFTYFKGHMDDMGKYFKEADAMVLVPVYQHFSQSSEQHVPKLWKCFLECAKEVQARCLIMLSVLNIDKAERPGLKMVCNMEKMFKECIKEGDHDPAPWSPDARPGSLLIKDHKFVPMIMFDLATGYMLFMSKYLKRQGDHHTSDFPAVDEYQDWMSESKAHIICVTGPEKVIGKCIAEVASSALGTKFEFKCISMDELEHYLDEHSYLDEEEIECMLNIFAHINKGYMNEVTKDLE
ncbi:hypothetical protein H4R33_001442 [Dimargaris cristalligena]|nr:hypothetical protein H4R33_001442 [Dimargaris cristalligena]